MDEIIATITPAQYEALERIFNYMFDEESDHFESCEADEKDEHVFKCVLELEAFLDNNQHCRKDIK